MASKGKAMKKKKGGKKKPVDAFAKKEWYVVKVPKFINAGNENRIGFTPAKKGGARKQLELRTFDVNLADLVAQPLLVAERIDHRQAKLPPDAQNKKFTFVTEDISDKLVLTQWHGMQITRDYRWSLLRKWQSLIECIVDVKTTDGYVLRVKAIAFTKRPMEQVKKNCYVKTSQARIIRARMRETIRKHVVESELKKVIDKLTRGDIGKAIQARCQMVFPLKNCMIERVKVIRKPKRDVAQLMKIHDLGVAFDPWDEEKERADAAANADEEDDGDDDDAPAVEATTSGAD